MRVLGPKTAELTRFCIAGGVGVVVDYVLLYVCTEYIGIRYLYSAAVSFTAAVILNYWLCLTYVFRTQNRQTTRQIMAFFAVSIVGLGLNQICMWALVEMAALWYMAAKLVATVVVMGWNYVMKKITIEG